MNRFAEHDELRDVAVTASGSILVAGYEGGRETATGELVESRGVVLEYANGFSRRVTLDTVGADSFESLAVASDTQRTWLAARTNGAVAGLPSYGGSDFMIGDLDAAGFHPSVRGHDSTHAYPRQLAAGAGLVAVAGYEERPASDGSTWIDPFLATFGASDPLAPLWTTTHRIPPAERYTAVDVAPHVIMTGGNLADGPVLGMFLTVRDDDAFTLWQRHLSLIGTDTIFLELDERGHALRDEQWSSEGDDVPTALAIDPCGAAVLVGHTTGDLAGPSHGARDGFVIVTRTSR